MKTNNPFKLGSVVDGFYFTDRQNELIKIKQVLDSKNHLILISPRRYGKTSLLTLTLSKQKMGFKALLFFLIG